MFDFKPGKDWELRSTERYAEDFTRCLWLHKVSGRSKVTLTKGHWTKEELTPPANTP